VHPWMGVDHRGLAIVRVSSKRQEGNISHDLQENEIRLYCERSGITLVEIVKIVESAKDSDDRKKYSQAVALALAQGIRHLLFYMNDRESRNLTDNERGEKLVKADLLVIHYVRESKVLWRESPDSDFFIRDVQAAANKQFIRNLSAKVNDAMRQKAENGWYPSNSPPLGYSIHRLKDENGKEIKRGGIIGRDPDPKRVSQVLREFELRALGMSYRQIRDQIIAEGFIPLEKAPSYNKATIEHRIHNPFYEGRFVWQGKEYRGRHELIIPRGLLERARQARRMHARTRTDLSHGVLAGGWLKCAISDCAISYDPKLKRYKLSGRSTVFHYYHCTNGRRMHARQVNVPEESIWEQLDRAVDAISLPPELAREVAAVLNETHERASVKSVRKISELRALLKSFETREDRLYDDFVAGTIDQQGYERQRSRIRSERVRVMNEIEANQASISGRFRETTSSILELSKNAKSLYLSRNSLEKRNFLDLILSNPRLEETTIRYDLRKPFSVLAEIRENQKWRARLDDLRTDLAAFHGGFDHGMAHLRITVLGGE